MAFQIKKRDAYRWTVEHVLERRAGKDVMMSFDAEFRALAKADIAQLMEQAKNATVSNEAFIDRIMTGWHELSDEEGKPVPFSVAAVMELCERYPGLDASISRAWGESVMGAARKN